GIERGTGLAEVVGSCVAKDEGIPAQMLFDGSEGAGHPLMAGRMEANFTHQQQAGLDITATEALRIAPQLRVPRLAFYGCSNGISTLLPVQGPALEVAMGSDFGETIASCPAHQRRRGVHPCAATELPHSRVRRRIDFERLFANPFQAPKITDGGRPHQPS